MKRFLNAIKNYWRNLGHQQKVLAICGAVVAGAISIILIMSTDLTPTTQAEYDEVQQQVMAVVSTDQKNLNIDAIIKNDVKVTQKDEGTIELSKSGEKCEVIAKYNPQDGSYVVKRSSKVVTMPKFVFQLLSCVILVFFSTIFVGYCVYVYFEKAITNICLKIKGYPNTPIIRK